MSAAFCQKSLALLKYLITECTDLGKYRTRLSVNFYFTLELLREYDNIYYCNEHLYGLYLEKVSLREELEVCPRLVRDIFFQILGRSLRQAIVWNCKLRAFGYWDKDIRTPNIKTLSKNCYCLNWMILIQVSNKQCEVEKGQYLPHQRCFWRVLKSCFLLDFTLSPRRGADVRSRGAAYLKTDIRKMCN